ncbi:pectate lyase [Pirellulaceae bacterium]|nr:pectate lyase [Pirellulaceae bacterium]
MGTKVEPPAISGDETQETIETLLLIAVATNNRKYLEPILEAIQWLTESTLSDGKLARYYELRTNRPLFMNRSGKNYFLT